jgi:hypothetical protein
MSLKDIYGLGSLDYEPMAQVHNFGLNDTFRGQVNILGQLAIT